MATCASCGNDVDPASGYYNAAGLVCQACMLAGENASQDMANAQRVAASQIGRPKVHRGGDTVVSEKTSRTVDADGTVHTRTTRVSVGGPLGWIVGLFLGGR